MDKHKVLLTALFNPIAETVTYIDRVETDGGTIDDPKLLDVLFRALVDNSLYSGLTMGFVRYGGYKESGGTVTKLYDISTNNNDVTVFANNVDLASTGIGFTANGYFASPTGDRSLTEWTQIIWVKPDTSDAFMGVAGDSFGHESNYIRTDLDLMYHIDSNSDFNSIGSGGATYLNNWNFFGWDGSDSGNEVKGWENASNVGTLTATELGQTADGRFRDEQILAYQANGIQGDWDLYLLYESRLVSADYTDIYNANKSIYGH